ncbi:MAG: hypothetical protein U1F56_02065 [Rubrivivax sp.]
MRSTVGESSVLMWIVSVAVLLLASRTFVQYLRRLVYEGPLRMWRELLAGSFALTAGVWSSAVLGVHAMGLSFEIGYHPLKTSASVAAAFVAVVLIVGFTTFRPRWYGQIAAAVVLGLVALVLQVGTIWAIGAEPGFMWRREALVFAALVAMAGLGLGGRIVVAARRGSRTDRGGFRLLAALLMGACLVASQELVLSAAGLDRQVASSHARFLSEMANLLVAGALVPLVLALMLADQYAQRRARASRRARRKRGRPASAHASESRFSESLLASELSDLNDAARR